MNKRLFLTAAYKGEKIEVLYLGQNRGDAQAQYTANKCNTDFDFVGLQVIPGFRARARPKILVAEEAIRTEAAIVAAELEVTRAAREARAAKQALGKAALEAEETEAQAVEKLKELAAPSGAKRRSRKEKVVADEGGLDLEGTETEGGDGFDDLIK
jgi:hypothetical protein